MADGIKTLEEQNEALNQGVTGTLNLTRDPNKVANDRAIRARIDAIKNSAEGQAMQAFVMSNSNGAQTPNAREQLRHYHDSIETIQLPDGTQHQDRLIWTAFKEIATEALVQAGNQETINQFIQRVSYDAPVQGTFEGEVPTQQPEVEEAPKQTESEADQYAERYLATVQTAFFQSHSKWLERHENMKNRQGLQLPYAQQLFSAVEYAFGAGRSRGGNKKWKELIALLYQQNPQLFGPDFQQFIQPSGGSIPKAIDMDILQAKRTNSEPQTIHYLREAVKSKDRRIRDIIEEHVLDSARILASPRAGRHDSINLSGDQGSFGDTIADQKAESPDAIEPRMSDTALRVANSAWDAFLGNQQNAQTIQQVRGLRHGHDEAGQPMLPLLVQRMKTDENDLIKQAIHTAFVGWSPDGTQKWTEFFKRHPQLTGGQTGDALLNQIAAIAGGQAEGLPQLQQFVLRSAYEFFVKNFEERGLDLRDRLSQLAPGVGNLKTFQRVNKMVTHYFLRHYDYMHRRGLESSAKESARRYALLKAKGDALLLKFQQLSESNEPIWLSKDTQLTRSPNSDAFVIRKRSKVPGTRQETWTEDIVQDDDFPLLQGIIANEEWVPRSIELMREKFPKDDVLKRDHDKRLEKNKRKDPQEQAKLAELDAFTNQYREQNPDETDRLKGFRIFMGQKIRQLREQRGMTIEQLAQVIKGPSKAGRPSGARISQDPIGMLERFEAGTAQRYGTADLEKLAEVLGFTKEVVRQGKTVIEGDPSPFYTRPDEYDPFSINDCTDLHSQVGQSFRTYGGYLLHRKKESIRRGIRNDFFSQRMMYFYLSVMQVHNLFSSKPQGKKKQNAAGQWEAIDDGSLKDSDQKVGKILYQLVGKPVGLGKGDLTMEDIQNNLGQVPSEDANEPGPPGGRKVPDFRGPRTFTDPETGRRSELPSDLVHRYYVDEDIASDPWQPGAAGADPAFLGPDEQPKHPDDIRRRFYQPDADQWLAQIERTPFKYDGEELPRDLNWYITNSTTKFREQAASQAPEQIAASRDRMSSVPLAKQIIRKIWPQRMVDGRPIVMDEATLQHMLQRKMEAANRYNSKHNDPTRYTLETFADKFIDDEIRISTYFRDLAQKRLQRMQDGPQAMSLLEQIRTFVPASVRRKAAFGNTGANSEQKGEKSLPPVSLKRVRNPDGIEKYDYAYPTRIVIAAMDELDRIGDLYESATHFTDIPRSLEEMLETTAMSAVTALAKFS